APHGTACVPDPPAHVSPVAATPPVPGPCRSIVTVPVGVAALILRIRLVPPQATVVRPPIAMWYPAGAWPGPCARIPDSRARAAAVSIDTVAPGSTVNVRVHVFHWPSTVLCACTSIVYGPGASVPTGRL